MSTILGQQMVVENKAGAIGTAEIARAAADGYPRLFGTVSTHGLYTTSIAD